MDYPVATNRWRTRAILFAALAAVELVVLVALGAVTAGRALVGEVETAAIAHELAPAQPKRASAQKRPMLPVSETSVAVLNGNGITGAAAGTATRVKSLSYVVAGVGNAARSDYTRSTVMYRKGFRREALALAKATGVELVGPLDGLRESDLMGAHLALVVGR